MLKVAIVGATGIVGQQFILALHKHPWFKISLLAASERSAGKTYLEAIKDQKTGALSWYCEEELPSDVLDMKVFDASKLNVDEIDLIFTAIEAEQARTLEPRFAQHKPVISTASAFRYEEDVPIIVPGVNSEHAAILARQREKRGWNGFITPIPNCTTTGLAITLKPIQENFGIKHVFMTSMQALSGAGRSPGVIGLDIIDNIIPFIPKEEEKVQTETLKILGKYEEGKVSPADFTISCTCTRVNVKDGHTESVFVFTKERCSVEEVKRAMKVFGTDLYEMGLPTAPKHLIVVRDDPYRPQPRLDRDTYGGMATVVGRLREDKTLGNGVKYLLVSHNTKMGAAKGAVLVAELLVKKGYIERS